MKKWTELKAGEGEKRQNIVVYPIEARCSDGPLKVVWRRYSDFELLRNHLILTYPHSIIPSLPDKRMSSTLYRKSQERWEIDQLEKRRMRLERFLVILSRHATISSVAAFHLFLQQDDETWKQKINNIKEGKMFQMLSVVNHALKINNNNKNNNNNNSNNNNADNNNTGNSNTTTNNNYANKASQENNEINKTNNNNNNNNNNTRDDYDDVVKGYIDHSTAISNQLNTFLKVSTKLSSSELQTGRLLQELGGLLSGWSVLEDDDNFQAAGHFVDAISQDVECYLDDHEHVIDSLRNHLSDLHAVKETCKRSLEENERPGSAAGTTNNSNLICEVEDFHRKREDEMAGVLLQHALVQVNKCRKASNSWHKVTESLGN